MGGDFRHWMSGCDSASFAFGEGCSGLRARHLIKHGHGGEEDRRFCVVAALSLV